MTRPRRQRTSNDVNDHECNEGTGDATALPATARGAGNDNAAMTADNNNDDDDGQAGVTT